MEKERPHIGGRHGFRLLPLLIPGMALLIQASVAGSVLGGRDAGERDAPRWPSRIDAERPPRMRPG
jgi:hypothetical protein